MQATDTTILAQDGYPLAATLYMPENEPKGVVTINAAMATPRRFYRHYANFFAGQGYTAITYDYRGISGSRSGSLRGFTVGIRDWIDDIDAVLTYAAETYQAPKLFHIGHSFGGQVAGLLPHSDRISAMMTFSSQSGYWRLQGGREPMKVALFMYVGFPLLCALFGYMPWSKLGAAEDLPKGVALDWARWCRHPRYLRGDDGLPLERYEQFTPPVLAYSFDDDDWGTARSVDDMMTSYPNLTRRHVVPAEVGLESIGHFGYFRPALAGLWGDGLAWLEAQTS